MADRITGILCLIRTADESGAGADGFVFVGFGGREFRLDSEDPNVDDFERNSNREYILGEPPHPDFITVDEPIVNPTHVSNRDKNDPRKGIELTTDDLDNGPAFIRFKGATWKIRTAKVRVYSSQGLVVKYLATENLKTGLWLGDDAGQTLRLPVTIPGPAFPPEPLPEHRLGNPILAPT